MKENLEKEVGKVENKMSFKDKEKYWIKLDITFTYINLHVRIG